MLKMNLETFENVDIGFTIHLIKTSLFLILNVEFFLNLDLLTEVLKIYIGSYVKQ